MIKIKKDRWDYLIYVVLDKIKIKMIRRGYLEKIRFRICLKWDYIVKLNN